MAPVILITGANRGLGHAITQVLAQAYPTATFLLTARDPTTLGPAIAALRTAGIRAALEPLTLDVSSDASISAAATHVRDRYGYLTVLINNAGIAPPVPAEGQVETRAQWAATMDVNVASVALLVDAFGPLLAAAPTEGSLKPTIVNVSSARASLTRSANGGLPPTRSVAYAVSKTALNMVTVEAGKVWAPRGVGVVSVSPGHCKTAFNGFKGKREPLEGARVVERILARGETEGFWEIRVDGGEVERCEW